MTRDEAEMAAIKAVGWDFSDDVRRFLAILEAIGLLKFDEPKRPTTILFKELGWPEGGVSYQEFFRCLEKAGLKLMER